MGGQPWLELELRGRPWGSAAERGERGRGRGRGGAARGAARGLQGGAMGRAVGAGAARGCSLLVLCCVGEEELEEREEKEKKEREKGKTKEKMEKLLNQEILREKNKR
jgi:hypothetical protein